MIYFFVLGAGFAAGVLARGALYFSTGRFFVCRENGKVKGKVRVQSEDSTRYDLSALKNSGYREVSWWEWLRS